MKDFAVVVIAYVPERITRFVKNLENTPFGDVDYDLFFIHNCIENPSIKNRWDPRPKQEVDLVSNTLRSYNGNKIIVERENVGEDLGAYHFAYNLIKHNYKYIFFVNEACSIHQPGWLRYARDFYDSNESVVALSPQMCRGIAYPYCLPSTYWSLRTSFDLNWPKPLSRADAEIQEMELVWPQAKAQGKHLAQIGDGSWFSYKNQSFFGEGIYI